MRIVAGKRKRKSETTEKEILISHALGANEDERIRHRKLALILKYLRDMYEKIDYIYRLVAESERPADILADWVEEQLTWLYLERVLKIAKDKARFRIVFSKECSRDAKLMQLYHEAATQALAHIINMCQAKFDQASYANTDKSLVRLFLECYSQFHKEKPCRGNSFAIKLTPVTLKLVRGIEGTVHTSKYVPVVILRAEPYIKRANPIDPWLLSTAQRKYWWEIVSFKTAGGRVAAEYEAEIMTAQDATRKALRLRKLGDCVRRPDWIVRDFAHAIGKPEAAADIEHCSVYFIPIRYTQTHKRYTYHRFEQERMLRYAYRRLHKFTQY